MAFYKALPQGCLAFAAQVTVCRIKIVESIFQKGINTTARNSQSTAIAAHTPTAPIRRPFANKYAAPIRKTHIEAMETIIANFTSPAARIDAIILRLFIVSLAYAA